MVGVYWTHFRYNILSSVRVKWTICRYNILSSVRVNCTPRRYKIYHLRLEFMEQIADYIISFVRVSSTRGRRDMLSCARVIETDRWFYIILCESEMNYYPIWYIIPYRSVFNLSLIISSYLRVNWTHYWYDILWLARVNYTPWGYNIISAVRWNFTHHG